MWDENTDWPLAWTYPTAVVTGVLGDFLLTMSCINAYIADEFPDKITVFLRKLENSRSKKMITQKNNDFYYLFLSTKHAIIL